LFDPPPVRRDRLKPLLGAFVCFLLFRVAFFFIEPVIQFFGKLLVALTLATLLSAAIASALAMAIFESRRMTDLGLAFHPGTRRNLLTGIGLGIAAAALVILIPVAFGHAEFQKIPNPDVSWGAALFMPLLLFCGAMGEEIVFRGFAMQYIARGWGMWPAIVGTGTIFGLLHGGNPDATWFSDLNTILFGILFGIAVWRTHELWLAIGLHFGWNITLPFLGTTLSGLTIRVTGYQWKWNTGNIWSGGAYGPEAGVPATIAIAALMAVLWKLPVAKGWAWLLDEPLPEAAEPVSQPESL